MWPCVPARRGGQGRLLSDSWDFGVRNRCFSNRRFGILRQIGTIFDRRKSTRQCNESLPLVDRDREMLGEALGDLAGGAQLVRFDLPYRPGCAAGLLSVG